MLDLHDMWFQQDGTTCHIASITMYLLRGEFGEHFISRSGPVNWPPRSSDVTHLDHYLWGYVKANVYTDKPASIDALEDNKHKIIWTVLWEWSQNMKERRVSSCEDAVEDRRVLVEQNKQNLLFLKESLKMFFVIFVIKINEKY